MKIEELKALRDRITKGPWGAKIDNAAANIFPRTRGGKTPGSIALTRDVGDVCLIADRDQCDANARAIAALPDLLDQCIALMEALARISKCDGAPDVDAVGDWQYGLHCGVEDRDCQNRYDGADYGHTVGAEKALEWASNEAQAILNSVGGGEDEY